MAYTHWLIQYQSGAYRFGRPRVDDAMTGTPQAEPTDPGPLASAMTEAGYGGQGAMLAIPSPWCLATSVVLASRRIMRNRQAVAFAVEEQLPLSAEDMISDYVAQQTDAFTVATDSALLLPIVRALEDVGIAVATITPTAMLLLQRLGHERRLPTDGLLLLGNGEYCDFFTLVRSRPRQWRCLPSDADAVTREVGALLLLQANGDDAPLPITTSNLGDAMASSLSSLKPDVTVADQPLDIDGAVLEEATNVLARGRRPWIELRRDQLGQYDPYSFVRGSMTFLLTASLITLVSMTVVAWMRGNSYEAFTESVADQKRALFQQLFPDARVPAGIRSRLESERRKLAGRSGGRNELPQLKSVTGFLVDVLAALPSDLRFRLLEMEFEEDTGYLEGEVRRHGDVDMIAASLRARGYLVEPPHTEQLAGDGVSFALSIAVAAPNEDPK